MQPDSRLASILGNNSTAVNSLHHQAIRDLAPGLVATAHAPDGVIEAVELPGHPFFVGLLFVPAAEPTDPVPHPVVSGFVDAVLHG